MGTPLPLAALQQALATRGGSVDATALPADDPLLTMVRQVAEAAMADLGIGVLELQHSNGRWHRLQGSGYERRIDGLTPVRCSGPAAAVFRNPAPLGYRGSQGAGLRGTFANCAGGTTPWGTVLSAEENVQSQVSEAVFADGSATAPSQRPFRWDGTRLDGLGNPFGLPGNHYGWMVEFDPRQPRQVAVKHSWLGRFRHEAVAVVARAGEPLIVYSGCDRHGGHLYRFVSDGRVSTPSDPANGRLLEHGRLEVARFEPGGSGRWLVLEPATRLDPQRPSHYARFGIAQPTLLPHGDRRRSGAQALASDADVDAYCQRHTTLADLYPVLGDDPEARLRQQGAILIDAHLAANAIGATAAARPEDTDIDPHNGDLLIAFTAAGRGDEGGADPAIFKGPAGQANWPHGWVMRLGDGGSARGARFSWRMEATGGTPWQGAWGSATPTTWPLTRRATSGSPPTARAAPTSMCLATTAAGCCPARGQRPARPCALPSARSTVSCAAPALMPTGAPCFWRCSIPAKPLARARARPSRPRPTPWWIAVAGVSSNCAGYPWAPTGPQGSRGGRRGRGWWRSAAATALSGCPARTDVHVRPRPACGSSTATAGSCA